MGRASKDKRDIYYRKAKEEGFRARSAYKLLQIDDEFGIFEGVTRAVDLCAAPGSWSQVLSQRLLPRRAPEGGAAEDSANANANADSGGDRDDDVRIVAVDLQEMSPIAGVTILQGDITTVHTAQQIVSSLGNAKAQLVICDGAPDVTGLHDLDEYVQHQLLLAAANITSFVLEDGGTFVSKIFRGPHTPFLCEKLEVFFRAVTVVKPKSSRNSSMECFVLCSGFRLPRGFTPSMIDPIRLREDQVNFLPAPDAAQDGAVQRRVVPFLACGSFAGYDADMSYPAAASVAESSEAGAARAGGGGGGAASCSLASLPPVQPPSERTACYAAALREGAAPQRRERSGAP